MSPALSVSYRADGRIGCVSNADVAVTYVYTSDGLDAGAILSFAGGTNFVRALTRDPFRRGLVTRADSSPGQDFGCAYDEAARLVVRNGDSFAYDARHQLCGECYSLGVVNDYAYDDIGNLTCMAHNAVTNRYESGRMNEYAGIAEDGRSVVTAYDADGNMTACGDWSYAYDANGRLAAAYSNGVAVAENAYDYKGRRVRMTTAGAAYTFVYDGWNVVLELVERPGTTDVVEYFWGKDASGTMQEAGGVGGLLYLKRNGAIYVPVYDAFGNVVEYRTAGGDLVAAYAYDAFGREIAASGPLAGEFRYRHATKRHEPETGFYYYGYRHYVPSLGRWLTPDPIEEDGGINLYGFCGNNALMRYDALGLRFKWDFMSCVSDCLDKWYVDWSVLTIMKSVGITEITRKTAAEHRGFDTRRLKWETTELSRFVTHAKGLAKRVKKYSPSAAARLYKSAEFVRHHVGRISSVRVPRFFNELVRFQLYYESYRFLYCSNKCCDKDGVRWVNE